MRLPEGLAAQAELAAIRFCKRRAAARGLVLKAHPLTGAGSFPGIPGSVPDAENVIAYLKAYQASSWIYSCVYAIASSGSMLPFKVEEIKDGRWVPVREDHPLRLLLEYPSEEQYPTGQDLMEAVYSDIELTGNAYLLKARDDNGITRELYRLRPDWTEPVPGKKKWLLGYIHRVNGRNLKYLPEDIIHIKTFNPLNERVGQSSLSAARLAATLDVQAQLRNKAFFKNDASPAGVLESEEDLSEDSEKRLREGWEKAHKGPNKAHTTAILWGGVKWKGTGISQKDMEYVTGREFSREEIAACFRVPPVMIGIFKYANYANSQEQKTSFWHETMIPKETKVAKHLTIALGPEHGDRGTVRVTFDLSHVHPLVKDEMEMAEVDIKLVQSGVALVNERRRARNLGPDLPHGDVWWAPLNLWPVSGPEPAAMPTAPRGAPQDVSSSSGGTPAPAPGQALPSSWRSVYSGDTGTIRLGVRDAAWMAMLIPLEKQINRAVRRILSQQEEEILANMDRDKRLKYTHVDAESWLFDFTYWRDGTIRAMTPQLLHVADSGGRFAMTELGLEVDFDLSSPDVQRAVREKVFKFAQEWPETTLSRLRTTLGEGIDAGENFKELRGRVLDAFRGRKDNATVVATTEVGAVSNRGALEGYVQSGVVPGKEWHSGGPNPRPHHLTIGGTFADSGLPAIAPVRGDFIVMGQPMAHPGDVRGRAENVCNCHCALLPVIQE